MILEHVKQKHILITIKAEEEDECDTVIKVKFYSKGDGSNELLVSFTRKSGDLMKWYDNFKIIKEIGLDYLRSPNAQNISIAE